MTRAVSIASSLGFWLALAGILGIIASPLGYRLGLWDFPFALRKLLALAALACVLGFLLCLFAWWANKGGQLRSGFSLMLILSGLLSAQVIWQIVKARSVPMIHDITTDTTNPPEFTALAQARNAAPNGAKYRGAEIADAQRRAYPDIVPFESKLTPDQLFARAEAAVHAAGWEMVAAQLNDGRIEATATSLLYGFKDDVVIRIRPTAGGSVLDMRSMSRVGLSDLGANAARIGKLRARLAE